MLRIVSSSSRALLVASILAFALPALAAPPTLWLSVEGSKQGRLRGDSTSKGGKGKITASAFHYEITSPRDASSGMASGKRQHSPLCVTKGVNESSPQLMTALVTNEALKTVLLELTSVAPDGAEQVSYTIKLTNAAVSKLTQLAGEDGLREEVCFTFQRIEEQSLTGRTSANDDLSGKQ